MPIKCERGEGKLTYLGFRLTAAVLWRCPRDVSGVICCCGGSPPPSDWWWGCCCELVRVPPPPPEEEEEGSPVDEVTFPIASAAPASDTW